MRQISFKMPGCWLVFNEPEIIEMLKSRPDIWEAAIRRGKPLSRMEKEGYRHGK